MRRFDWPNKVRLRSCWYTDFLTLCGPTSMDQRGTLSTSTHYRRKHLESRGFDMRWQQRIVTDDRSNGEEEGESRRTANHVLREGGKEAARASTTPQDAVATEDEAYRESNSPSHEGTHFHFLPNGWFSASTMSRGRRRHFLFRYSNKVACLETMSEVCFQEVRGW